MKVETEELERLAFKPYKISISIEDWKDHEDMKYDLDLLVSYLERAKNQPGFKGFYGKLLKLLNNIRIRVVERPSQQVDKFDG